MLMADTDLQLGVCLNCVGSIMVNMGTNFFKASFAEEAKSNKHYYGIVYFSLGSFVNFVSFAYASQTALAALGGVQFVSNIACGHFILREEVTLRHIMAVLILMVGVTFSVCNASKESSGMIDPQGILSLYDENYFRLILILVATMGACECLYRYYDKQDARVLASLQPRQSSLPRTDVPTRHAGAFLCKPLAFALPSAVFGTQAALQGKCMSGLIRLACKTNDISPVVSCAAALALVVFFVCLAVWLSRLYEALRLFDGLLIIPLLQTCWIITAVVQGGTFFKEFTEDLSLFFVGIAMLLLGVYVLASAYNNATHDESDEKFEVSTESHVSPLAHSSKMLCLSPRAHVFTVVSNQDLTNLVVGFPLASPVQSNLHFRRTEWHALHDAGAEEEFLHKETV